MTTPTPAAIEALFCEWWALSYPIPPGERAIDTHARFGQLLLDLRLQRQQQQPLVDFCPAQIENFLREWWALQNPAPPGAHSINTYVGFGAWLLAQQLPVACARCKSEPEPGA